MPSSRRRRFSVQNKNRNQEVNTPHNDIQICSKLEDIHLADNVNRVKYKNKIHPNISKNVSTLEILTECKSTASTTAQANGLSTSDKGITASSSNINLYTNINNQNTLLHNEPAEVEYKSNQKEYFRRERAPHRDKYFHRVVVRSPKRKVSHVTKEVKRKSVGITVEMIDGNEYLNNYDSKLEVIKQVIEVGENTDREEEEISSHSLGNMCRICHSGDAISDAGNLISACSCRGTIGRVHVKCLERWLTESGKSRCELCGTKYVTRRVHRFGIFKAFIMWILSHNSKNMIVDFFGIMIMTPIAVVGASLTERTFARLVAQDSETPWPLASTFVLACMTLVCYYCWIVSALTRHALGWWIWYRSHYEVRLQLPEEE